MDWRSLIGLVIAVGAIFAAQWSEGGHVGALLQPTGLLVVLAGTFGAVLLQSGPARLWDALRLLRHGFGRPARMEPAFRQLVRQWGAIMRRSGALALESSLRSVKDPFVARGLRLLVDGVTPSRIADILARDTDAFEQQRRQAIRVWETAGGTAPTMGILGAVLGLVQVMEQLSDPGKLGPGIAVAFVATLYGVGFANLVFLPIANRLKEQLASELHERDGVADAIVAIASGEPGHLIEERVAAPSGSLPSSTSSASATSAATAAAASASTGAPARRRREQANATAR